MSQYNELSSPDYKMVTIEGNEPEPIASDGTEVGPYPPENTAPNRFTFSGLGKDGEGVAEVVLHIGEFATEGFNGIPPEALLLVLLKHYEGLQESSIASPEYRMVVNNLNDCVASLKGRNDIRQWYGKYGTIDPN